MDIEKTEYDLKDEDYFIGNKRPQASPTNRHVFFFQ